MASFRLLGHDDRRFIRLTRIGFLLLLISILFMGCAHGRSMDRGDELYVRGDYANALSAYQEALSVKPGSKDAQQGIFMARSRIVEGLVAEGTAELEQDQVIVAFGYWEQAVEVPGDYIPLKRFGKRLIVRALELADGSATDGDYAHALAIYDTFGQSNLADGYQIDVLASELSDHWAGILGKTAAAQLQKGHFAYALLLLAQAVELNQDASQRIARNELWNQVEPTLQYMVRIDAAANRIPVTSFASGDSRSIRIITDGSNTETFANATVSVGKFEPLITHRRSTSTWVAEYQSGMASAPNPDYERLERGYTDAIDSLRKAQTEIRIKHAEVSRRQSELDRLRRKDRDDSEYMTKRARYDLESANEDLDRALRTADSKSNDVGRVDDEMNRTSSTIEWPVYSEFRYPVITHEAEGSINVEISIKHSDGRATRKVVKTLRLEVSEDEHDSHPIINLAAKYNNIPSDALLEEQLIQMSVELVRDEIRQSFDDYREVSLAQANLIVDQDAQMDALVRYLLLSGESKHPDVSNTIYERVGIWDTQSVLTRMKR